MNTNTSMAGDYDVIVVGARPAGAGTALLLARHGLKVLLVDRGQYGTDTLSTHALMRGGVLQLSRWDVLPRIIAAGTPPVRRATFVYDGDALTVPVKPRDGVEALYAPRRTVLDRALVDAAVEAGVEVSYRTRVVGVLRDASARVGGIVAHTESGWAQDVRARIVIGADGLRSTIAGLVRSEVTTVGRWSSANVYGYWADVPADGYRWYYAPGSSVGAIPTNDGRTCIFASVATSRWSEIFGAGVGHGYHTVIQKTAPDLAAAMTNGRLVGALHGFPGVTGYVRRSAGPGWALVGDAGYFKDPITAHGITDALIEAEGLALAVVSNEEDALRAYDEDRVERVRGIFEVTDRIASFEWTLDEARRLHKRLADAMGAEVKALHATAVEGALV